MSIIRFGEYIEGKKYKVLDERQVRASSGIMFLLGMIAFVNGFIFKEFEIIPIVSGILLSSFLIAVFINPKFSPTMFVGYLFVRKQSPLPIGAVQKRFAWSLGIVLSAAIFILSLFLVKDPSYFDRVCELCIICLVLLFLETAFGICVGCKLYHLALKMKLLRKPIEKPNCMGDACEVE